MHSSKATYNNANVLREESLTATDTSTIVDLEGMKSKIGKKTTWKKKGLIPSWKPIMEEVS